MRAMGEVAMIARRDGGGGEYKPHRREHNATPSANHAFNIQTPANHPKYGHKGVQRQPQLPFANHIQGLVRIHQTLP